MRESYNTGIFSYLQTDSSQHGQYSSTMISESSLRMGICFISFLHTVQYVILITLLTKINNAPILLQSNSYINISPVENKQWHGVLTYRMLYDLKEKRKK